MTIHSCTYLMYTTPKAHRGSHRGSDLELCMMQNYRFSFVVRHPQQTPHSPIRVLTAHGAAIQANRMMSRVIGMM